MVESIFHSKTGVSKAWVCRVVEKVLRVEKTRGSICVLITGDRQIRRINKEFLNHDHATDVISFDLGEKNLMGEIVVSADTARRVSKELGVPFREELARYLIHGTLHLLGYDDKNKKDFERMRKRQEEILTAFL